MLKAGFTSVRSLGDETGETLTVFEDLAKMRFELEEDTKSPTHFARFCFVQGPGQGFHCFCRNTKSLKVNPSPVP